MIVKTFDTILGRFEFYGTPEGNLSSHDWAGPTHAKIAENTEENTPLLVLCDRLEEESNPAAHMLRLIFQPGYEVPAGFCGEIALVVVRPGSSHRQGYRVTYGRDASGTPKPFGFVQFTGTSFGDASREQVLAQVCGKFTLVGMTVSGQVPVTVRVLPEGSEVIVTKCNTELVTTHRTRVALRVTEFKEVNYSWGGSNLKPRIVFSHMGYEISCLKADVISVQ